MGEQKRRRRVGPTDDRVAGGAPPFRRVRAVRPAVRPFPFAALLATALVAMTAVAVAAAPSLAQTSGGDPPDYVLEEDGTVVIDGDLATDCPSFAESQPGADADPNREQARAVLEQCEKAGLLDPGGGARGASPGASASPGVPAADGEGAGLPETGGPALPALLVVAVAVAAAGGLLARKVA